MARSRRPLVLLTSLLALGLASVASLNADAAPAPGPSAAAKPRISNTFVLPEEPQRIIQGPGSSMWFTGGTAGVVDDVSKINAAGVVTSYDLDPVSGLQWLTVGPDGNIWATTSQGVARIPVANPTAAVQFVIPGFTDPQGITLGPDDNLWAAGGDTLWKVKLSDPAAATPFTVPGMQSKGVTATSSRVVVADFTGKVQWFRTDGAHTTVDVGGSLQGIEGGPKNQVLYTNTEAGNNHAGLLSLGQTTPRKIPLPNTDPSFSVAFGADGAYWVGLFLKFKMARITTTGKLSFLGTFPDELQPRFVAAGPHGTIWVSLQHPGDDGAIARISGVVGDKVVNAGLASTRLVVKRGKAGLRLRCRPGEKSGPCTGRVVLRGIHGQHPRLGSKRFTVRKGRTGTVKVALDRGTLGSIGRDGLRARALVVVRDKAGNKLTIDATVRLVRP